MIRIAAAGCVSALLLCAGGGVAQAQAVDSNGRTVYDAAFFAAFQPASALQVIERVPGFTLEQVDEEVRGFGQAAGNVVINGQRPSSKSDTIEVILSRIPANRVARVEVASGAAFGSEYAGKAQVANLVLTGAGGVAGTLEGTLRRSYTGELFPEASASALLKRGNSTFNAAVGIDNEQTTEEGFDTLVALPGGELLEYRRKVNAIDDPNGFVSASWNYKNGAFSQANLNGRFAIDRFALTQYNDVTPADGPVRDDRLTQRYHRRDIEIGGDVTQPLLGGGIKLIGLITRRHRLDRDVSLNRVQSAVIGGFEQTLENQRDESVVRAVWNRADLVGWAVEFGAEGALNRLDSRVDLFALDDANGRTRIDLPVDDAVVEEKRGEAFVNAGRAVTKKLRLDLALNYEASRLTVTGDAQAARTLSFLKPKVTLDWRPAQGWRVQGSLGRTVAQLQFEDFIGVAELANDRVNGGNANLVPQRAWEALATIERTVLKTGLVKLELGYNRIQLVQDRVPTPEGFDAPGNLGDGSSRIARATFDVPLASFGVKGGRISGRLSYLGTSVRDPYTLANRPFSGTNAFVWEANWRQDLGRFAWGFGAEGNSASTFYRRDETDRLFNGAPYATAFAEYRPTRQTTLSIGLENAIDASGKRERTFYDPDRRTPSPFARELRVRDAHIIAYIGVKHNFG